MKRLFVAVVCVAYACGSSGPSGFWTTYRSDLVVDRCSDQGPWGGIRWIHWLAPETGTFSEEDVRRFAEDHGWRFLDGQAYSGDVTRSWQYNGKAVFPLYFPQRGETTFLNSSVERFPLHIEGQCEVLQFDSGWMRENPGSGEMAAALGYVVLSEDGRKMAVYHFWGNG